MKPLNYKERFTDQKFSCFPIPRELHFLPNPNQPNEFHKVPGVNNEVCPGFDHQVAGSCDYNLSSSQLEATSNLIPYIICGEESSAIAFHREAHKVGILSSEKAAELAYCFEQVAKEEAQHEFLLRKLALHLPPAKEKNLIKKRARKFYLYLAQDRDSGTHFAKIAALDSQVCKIMVSLLSKNSAISKSPKILFIVNKILKDEARHVAISKRYASQLGLSQSQINEIASILRKDLVEFLWPAGQYLDILNVDPDRLFSRIRGTMLI